jgi:hypothetical protein
LTCTPFPTTPLPESSAGRIQLNSNSATGQGNLWWFKPPRRLAEAELGFESATVSVALTGLVR